MVRRSVHTDHVRRAEHLLQVEGAGVGVGAGRLQEPAAVPDPLPVLPRKEISVVIVWEDVNLLSGSECKSRTLCAGHERI